MEYEASPYLLVMQILKEKAVDPMQALVPCHMLPGQNVCTVLTPCSVCCFLPRTTGGISS